MKTTSLISAMLFSTILIIPSCHNPDKLNADYLIGKWQNHHVIKDSVEFYQLDTSATGGLYIVLAESDNQIWEFTTDHKLLIPNWSNDCIDTLRFKFERDSAIIYITDSQGDTNKMPMREINRDEFHVYSEPDISFYMSMKRIH
jgi:hypothetical protein